MKNRSTALLLVIFCVIFVVASCDPFSSPSTKQKAMYENLHVGMTTAQFKEIFRNEYAASQEPNGKFDEKVIGNCHFWTWVLQKSADKPVQNRDYAELMVVTNTEIDDKIEGVFYLEQSASLEQDSDEQVTRNFSVLHQKKSDGKCLKFVVAY